VSVVVPRGSRRYSENFQAMIAATESTMTCGVAAVS
jgi:hypothetical protein